MPPAISSQLANQARTLQAAVRARLVRDVITLWPALDPTRLDSTWPGWLRLMRAAIGGYHRQSSAAAKLIYQQQRTQAIGEPGPDNLVRIAPEPDPQWVARALGYAAPARIDQLMRQHVEPDRAAADALTLVIGTAERITADGGRATTIETVARDPAAVGWFRYPTNPKPCWFCFMLAGRGDVYSEQTAKFEPHNNCGCLAFPRFSKAAELPEVNRRAAALWAAATAGVKGSDNQRKAFRRAHEGRSLPGDPLYREDVSSGTDQGADRG